MTTTEPFDVIGINTPPARLFFELTLVFLIGLPLVTVLSKLFRAKERLSSIF